MKKRILGLIFVLLGFLNLKAQSKVDTNLIYVNAELKLFLSKNMTFRRNEIAKILDIENRKINIIKTRGIENMFFFEICLNQIFRDKFFLFQGTALFAYDIFTDKIYYLNNENTADNLNFVHILSIRIKENFKKNREDFLEEVEIDKIDMKKVYKVLKGSRKGKNLKFTKTELFKISMLAF